MELFSLFSEMWYKKESEKTGKDRKEQESAVPGCCTFVNDKAGKPCEGDLWVVETILTLRSDNPYGGKGTIRMAQKDYPDNSFRLSEQPTGDPLSKKIMFNF